MKGVVVHLLYKYLFTKLEGQSFWLRDEEKYERVGYLHGCSNKYALQGTQANGGSVCDRCL